METGYSISDITLCNFMTLLISFIKSRLDISPHFATKEKPCCDRNRALLSSDRQMLAFVRDGNNKVRSCLPVVGLQGFFFGLQPKASNPPEFII
jgi:hypothetical protein